MGDDRGAQRAGTISHISRISELPPYEEVVSGPGGSVRMSEEERERFACLLANSRGGREVFLICRPGVVGKLEFHSVRQRIRQANYIVSGVYTAEPEVFAAIAEAVDGKRATGMPGEMDQTKIEEMVYGLLMEARRAGSSDIHIRRNEDEAVVLFRIHGRLRRMKEWTTQNADKFCRVAFTVLGGAQSNSVWNPEVMQEASIQITQEDGTRMGVRYAQRPKATHGTYVVVMRILSAGKLDATRDMTSLGYSQSQVRLLQAMLRKPRGMIVFAGATGSGKSTSMAHCLAWLNDLYGGEKHILSVEDPPEYEIPGVVQTPARATGQDTDHDERSPFALAIRNAMRLDPDLLMVGEVRDPDTARTVKQAVLTDHKVITTVHAASAIEILYRLNELGIDYSVLGAPNFIGGLIYQRLVRVLCPECKEPISRENAPEDLYARVMEVADVDSVCVKGSGCKHCGREGVVGRTVCAEAIIPDTRMLELISGGQTFAAMKHWKEMADDSPGSSIGKSAMQHAIGKMRSGIVAPDDVESEFGPLTYEHVMADDILSPTEETMLSGTRF